MKVEIKKKDTPEEQMRKKHEKEQAEVKEGLRKVELYLDHLI